MEYEYNDYQILSPSIMEKIAREYNLLNQTDNFEKSNLLDKKENINISDLEEYKFIVSNFETVFSNLLSLKKYCSKKFYYKKEIEITSILSKIENLFTSLNHIPKNDNNIKHNNYCEIVTDSINLVIGVIEKSLELFIKVPNKTFAHKIHTESLTILTEIVNLIGTCKYRSLF